MRVRVVGASSPFPPERFAAGLGVLRERGFVVDDRDVVHGSHAYLNGSDDDRAAAVNAVLAGFERGDVDVVWCARGGYGLTRILDRIVVPKRIPVVVGFSDVTALFARLHNEGHGARCVHGPLCTSIVGEPDVTRAAVVDVIAGRAVDYPKVHNRVAGRARGPLFAGNLCVLTALCGTRHQPELRGHVVVVEEVGERPYRIDRMLTQCLQAGLFDGVAGVVVGHLTSCEEPTGNGSFARDPAPQAIDVVIERLSTLGVPVFSGLPVGHEAPNWALPLGKVVVVDGDSFVVEPP